LSRRRQRRGTAVAAMTLGFGIPSQWLRGEARP
jgi:hypothetical protein